MSYSRGLFFSGTHLSHIRRLARGSLATKSPGLIRRLTKAAENNSECLRILPWQFIVQSFEDNTSRTAETANDIDFAVAHYSLIRNAHRPSKTTGAVTDTRSAT